MVKSKRKIKSENINPKDLSWFKKRKWLIGIDAISEHTDYSIVELIDFITHWPDCPIEKYHPDSIWIVQKSDIDKFIEFVEENEPLREEEVPEVIYKKPKIQRRNPKWHL